MSITFTDSLQYLTDANALWGNQPNASLSFFVRVEASGGIGGFLYAMLRQYGSDVSVASHKLSDSQWQLTLSITGSPGTDGAYLQTTLSVGSVYHIAVTYASGSQLIYINGVPTSCGTSPGNTHDDSARPWILGGLLGGAPCITLSDVFVVNGYTFTPTDVTNLRDKVQTPAQLLTAIGSGAYTLAAEWTLAGPNGVTPAIHDTGLNDTVGSSPFTLITGSGTAAYSAPLGFAPSVGVETACVGTSGKTIGFLFHNLNTLARVCPSSLVTAPTVYRNGTSLGQLIAPLITGYHESAMFSIPNPAANAIVPTDVITLSAPIGWMIAGTELVTAITAFPVVNCVGRSMVGTDSLRKTFKPGMNFGASGPWYLSQYRLTKNWLFNSPGFSNVTAADANGKPLTLSASPARGTIAANNVAENGFDRTQWPGLPGLYAVGWDTPPGGTTTFDFSTDDWTNTSVTDVSSSRGLGNPGSGGVGKVRVFDVQHAGGATSASLHIVLELIDATLSPLFSNLVVYGPGDFTYTDGVPVVLDRSNPYAISNTVFRRFPNGLGSIRGVDSTMSWGGRSSISEPEHLPKLIDFQWGADGRKFQQRVGFTGARPWNPAVTGYMYSDLFGSPYPATLASAIDSVQTTITIADAATAPVIKGLRLLMPSGEQCRVLGVSGTSVTVERGAVNTTAVPQAAGSIQVLSRLAITGASWGTTRIVELVTDGPHGLRTGMHSSLLGDWPTWTYTDGASQNLASLDALFFVTGATTMLITIGGTVANNTITTSYVLVPANTYLAVGLPEGPSFPHGFLAMVAAAMGADFHVNTGFAMSDSCVDAVAAEIFAHYPSGGTLWLEVSDEPWNWTMGPQNGWFTLVSQNLYPGGFGMEYLCDRTAQTYWRFANMAAKLGWTGQIKSLLNCQMVNPGSGDTYLTHCRTHTVTVDGVAHPMPVGGMAAAAYYDPDTSLASRIAAWQYDDDQVIDMIVNDIWYNTQITGFNAFQTAGWQSIIAAYNAATGNNCVLYGYEGGFEAFCPGSGSTLTHDVLIGDSSIQVASTDGLLPTMMIVVGGTELMLINSIAGLTLNVSRAQAGLPLLSPTAVAHASGDNLRNCYSERDCDLRYNPLIWDAEQDMYALWQQYYVRLNIYELSAASVWDVYRWQGQKAGRGDGSDGKANNRLCLMRPGQAHTKAATVNQDETNVSVRGQALIDWTTAMAGSTVTVPAGQTTATFTITAHSAGARTITLASTVPSLTIAGSPIIYTAALPPGLAVNPGRIAPGKTTVVTFVGTGTHWTTSAPTFTATGPPTSDGAWSRGAVTVTSDTTATQSITTGTTKGTVTFTDSTTGQTTTLIVGLRRIHWVPRRYGHR